MWLSLQRCPRSRLTRPVQSPERSRSGPPAVQNRDAPTSSITYRRHGALDTPTVDSNDKTASTHPLLHGLDTQDILYLKSLIRTADDSHNRWSRPADRTASRSCLKGRLSQIGPRGEERRAVGLVQPVL